MSTLFERVERSKGGEAQPTQPKKPAAGPAVLVPAVWDAGAINRNAARNEVLRGLRASLQTEVVRAFDQLVDVPDAEIRTRVGEIADRVTASHGYAVTRDERLGLVQELIDEVIGFGPLEPYLKDESITEVMVNGPDHVYIERRGKILEVESTFLERRARPARHRPDHHPHRTPYRRVQPARGRPPARWLPCQRDHRAALPCRPGHHHPQVLDQPVHGR